MDDPSAPKPDDLVTAVGEAMRQSSMALPGSLRTMRILIKKDDEPGIGPIRPFYASGGSLQGFIVYPAYLNLSERDRGVYLRRAMMASYQAPLVRFAQQLIDTYVTNPDSQHIIQESFNQITEMALDSLSSTVEDLLDTAEFDNPDDLYSFMDQGRIQAEA